MLPAYRGFINIGKGGIATQIPRGFDKVRVKKHDDDDEPLDTRLTAAEIIVLRAVHGEDCVIQIEPIGPINRTQRAERERLDQKYGEKRCLDLFGPKGVKDALPTEIDPYDQCMKGAKPVDEDGKPVETDTVEAELARLKAKFGEDAVLNTLTQPKVAEAA